MILIWMKKNQENWMVMMNIVVLMNTSQSSFFSLYLFTSSGVLYKQYLSLIGAYYLYSVLYGREKAPGVILDIIPLLQEGLDDDQAFVVVQGVYNDENIVYIGTVPSIGVDAAPAGVSTLDQPLYNEGVKPGVNIGDLKYDLADCDEEDYYQAYQQQG
ncbi:MAG: hypothetical protein EZS28_050018, partial [Streblomastix strix]